MESLRELELDLCREHERRARKLINEIDRLVPILSIDLTLLQVFNDSAYKELRNDLADSLNNLVDKMNELERRIAR